MIVAPSILSADFCNLQRDCQLVLDYGADWLHVDIMDGYATPQSCLIVYIHLLLLVCRHFVPNLTIGLPVVRSLRQGLPPATFLDCHLMIENPELWVERVCRAGASGITFHLEATTNALTLAQRIKSLNVLCGVALKPGTPVSQLSDALLQAVDMVLVMTVEPGFGGQKLVGSCVEKVRVLRGERKYTKMIQVDGGVDEGNVGELKAAGANVIVAGSSIFNAENAKSAIDLFKQG